MAACCLRRLGAAAVASAFLAASAEGFRLGLGGGLAEPVVAAASGGARSAGVIGSGASRSGSNATASSHGGGRLPGLAALQGPQGLDGSTFRPPGAHLSGLAALQAPPGFEGVDILATRASAVPAPNTKVPQDYDCSGVLFYTRGFDGAVSNVLLGVSVAQVTLRSFGFGDSRTQVRLPMLQIPRGQKNVTNGSMAGTLVGDNPFDTAMRWWLIRTADAAGLSSLLEPAATGRSSRLSCGETLPGQGVPLPPSVYNIKMKTAVVLCQVGKDGEDPPVSGFAPRRDGLTIGRWRWSEAIAEVEGKSLFVPPESWVEEASNGRRLRRRNAVGGPPLPAMFRLAWVPAGEIRRAINTGFKAEDIDTAQGRFPLHPFTHRMFDLDLMRQWLGIEQKEPHTKTSGDGMAGDTAKKSKRRAHGDASAEASSKRNLDSKTMGETRDTLDTQAWSTVDGKQGLLLHKANAYARATPAKSRAQSGFVGFQAFFDDDSSTASESDSVELVSTEDSSVSEEEEAGDAAQKHQAAEDESADCQGDDVVKARVEHPLADAPSRKDSEVRTPSVRLATMKDLIGRSPGEADRDEPQSNKVERDGGERERLPAKEIGAGDRSTAHSRSMKRVISVASVGPYIISVDDNEVTASEIESEDVDSDADRAGQRSHAGAERGDEDGWSSDDSEDSSSDGDDDSSSGVSLRVESPPSGKFWRTFARRPRGAEVSESSSESSSSGILQASPDTSSVWRQLSHWVWR